MAIGRPSEMKLKEDARRIVLERKQQSDVKSKKPADEEKKQAETGGAAGQQGAPVDYFANVPGLNYYNQQGGPANNNQQITSPLAVAAGAAGQGVGDATGFQRPFDANKYLVGERPKPPDMPAYTADSNVQAAIQKNVQGLSEAEDALKQELAKGPDKVKDILDLKRVGILAGGALLAKLLGVNDGYIAEFVGGFLPAVQKEQEQREAKAQMEHQQKIAGIKSQIEAHTSALAALAQQKHVGLSEFATKVQATQVAWGMQVDQAQLAMQEGRLIFDADQANHRAATQSVETMRAIREQWLQMLQSATPESLPDIVRQYNTLSLALSQKTGIPVPLITNDMVKALSGLLEMKGRSLKREDTQAQAEFALGLRQNIINYLTGMRKWLFAPNQKVAAEMMAASADMVGNILASIDFPSDEERMRVLKDLAPFVKGLWTSRTQEEAALGLQEKALSVEEWYKRAFIAMEGRKLDMALLEMMTEASLKGRQSYLDNRKYIIENVIIPTIRDVMQTGWEKLQKIEDIEISDMSEEDKLTNLTTQVGVALSELDKDKSLAASVREGIRQRLLKLLRALNALSSGERFEDIVDDLVAPRQGGAGGGRQQGQ